MKNNENTASKQAEALSNWYGRALRAFLAEHAPGQLAQLDDEDKRLRRLLEQQPDTVVRFVGPSGIGKSTLINALVAEEKTLAPSGGVGPLTALATEVRYSETPRLRAEYHTKAHLWRVGAALNFQVMRNQKEGAIEPTVVAAPSIDEIDRQDIEQETREGSEPENEGSVRRMDELIRMARLMVAGNQNEARSLEYLADAISMACSVKTRWQASISQEDSKRIERLRIALQMAERGEALSQTMSGDARLFRETLRDHAAGFLSPLIKRIEVGWPSKLLEKGLVLVDLPGVGVAGDVYKKETQRFVREKARAVVLVVDRAGPTESVMDLLRTTGYWDRLVLSSDDPTADPCSLLLSVTRVDDLAAEEWRAMDPDEEGRRPKSKVQIFDEVRSKLKDGMRKQLEQELASFTHTEGSTAIREGRESAARNLLDSLRIHPISAIEYRKLIADNDEDCAFLKSHEQTGVPAFSNDLLALARVRQDQRASNLQALTQRFAALLWNQLGTVEVSWRSDRASAEAERIRSALQVVLDEKNREYENRRSSFRTFLNETVPEKINVAIHEAKDQAQKDVNAYLRNLQDAHWATLRAAVQRGGTYIGARHIDLPSDIALRFQDPVAAVWSQSLLKSIREKTYQLAKDIRELVDEVCDWAEREQAAFVDERVLQAQKKLVSMQAERLRDVGKEAIDELRELVKIQIVKAIDKPIHKVCRKFVEDGNNVGRGVKHRILEMFRELSASATEAASVPTKATLLSHYQVVNDEIRKAFEEWGHPLQSAADAIVQRHEDHSRRSDSQKRQRVLATIAEIRAEIPSIMDLVHALTEAQRA